MRVPTVRPSCHGDRWETIRYALDSNPRTFRLCLILVVLTASSVLAAAIAVRYGSGAVHAARLPTSWFSPAFR